MKDFVKNLPKKIKRILVVAICVVIVVVVFLQFFSLKVVHETQMADTLEQSDLLLLARHAYSLNDPEFGDIILHTSFLTDDNGDLIELYTRIVGLPGDEIEVRDGGVFRNGELLEGPSAEGGAADVRMPPVTLPPGCYFVLSDDRQEGLDSRDGRVGYITIDQIKGKVVFRLLPASRMGGV